MNFNTLKDFRQELYGCFGQSRDALFNLADALLSETTAHSVIELSLSPFFERKWPSLYAALQFGKLDQARFEQTLVNFAPPPLASGRLVLAVDASNIERPFSETSSDRGYLYVHNLPECDKPVTVGWQFSTVVVLPAQSSSHTYIVSNRRIPTSQTPAQVAATQLKELRPYFEERPINLGDRYYPTKAFLVEVSPDYDLLVRLKANRVFYRQGVVAPVGERGRGAPAKHGARFQCNAEATHGPPDREWQGVDEAGAKLAVSEWKGLHLRQAPQLPLSIMRVCRYGESFKRREPIESWFVWSGQSELELSEVWATYKRRFSIEHGFRFDKQELLWCQPRLREPRQFELWTALVSMVHDELVVAEGLGLAILRPWESRHRALSPQQIRRGLGAIMDELGSPARPSQSRGKGRGRAFGAKIEPALRYKVVRKSRKKAKVA
jgi:DDE superfamily endonuclease